MQEDRIFINQVGEKLKSSWDEAMAAQVMLEQLRGTVRLNSISKEELIDIHIKHCEITRRLVEYIDDSLDILLNIER